MSHALAIVLHLVSAVVWIGGMFFAYVALRPVTHAILEPPMRQTLWSKVFARFFPWVWIAVVALPVSGYWMAFRLWHTMGNFPVHIHLMQGIGIAMMLIFMHIFFAPYRRLCRAVEAQQWEPGGKALGQIRKLIGINLGLGILLVVTAAAGRYL